MADRLLRALVALTAGLTVIAWTLPLQARGDLPKALGLLPQDSDMVVTWDYTAEGNPQSALSLISSADMRQILLEEDPDVLAFDRDEPIESPAEVMARIILTDEEFSGKIEVAALAFTFASIEPVEQEEYLAVLGTFSQDEAAAALEGAGGRASGNGLFQFPRGQDGTQVRASAPEDGVLLATTEQGWLGRALELGSERQGLMAPNSRFVNSAMTLGGRRPDAMIYLSGSLIQQGFREVPLEARGFVGPFAQSRGILITTFPAEKLRFELHSAFDNPQQANMANQFLTQAISMANMALQGALREAGTQDEQEALQEIMRALREDVRITTSRNSTLLRIEFTRPDPEEVHSTIRDMLAVPAWEF